MENNIKNICKYLNIQYKKDVVSYVKKEKKSFQIQQSDLEDLCTYYGFNDITMLVQFMKLFGHYIPNIDGIMDSPLLIDTYLVLEYNKSDS